MSQLSLAYDTRDLALHYEEVSADRQFRFGKTLVDFLGVRAGERVLDVGSGTGLLARHVADLVGPGGYVAGIDPLPLRVAIARQKARPNLHFDVGSVYDLSDFGDASFDVVYLNAVFHWLPEKLRPLQQIARVLLRGAGLVSRPARGTTAVNFRRSRPLCLVAPLSTGTLKVATACHITSMRPNLMRSCGRRALKSEASTSFRPTTLCPTARRQSGSRRPAHSATFSATCRRAFAPRRASRSRPSWRNCAPPKGCHLGAHGSLRLPPDFNRCTSGYRPSR